MEKNEELKLPMQKLFSFLSEKHAEYQYYEHVECRTSQESASARATGGAPEAIGAKALLIKAELKDGQTVFYLLVLPGNLKVDKKKLKAVLSNLRGFELASREDIALLMDGLVPGSVPPFGSELFQKIDKTWIDQSLFNYEYIGFNAACLTQSIVMTALEYKRIMENVSIIDFAI